MRRGDVASGGEDVDEKMESNAAPPVVSSNVPGSALVAPLSTRSRGNSVAWCDTPTVYNMSSEPNSENSNLLDGEDMRRLTRHLPCIRGSGVRGSGWRLSQELVQRVYYCVGSARDLRSCRLVNRSWNKALGHPEGVIAKRLANSWEPYSGCWWIPKDANTLMIVHLRTESMNHPTGEGLVLRKHCRPTVLGGEYETHVEKSVRTVRVELTPSRLVIKWLIPLKSAQGPRTHAQVGHGVYDCSAVVQLSSITYPTPGKPIPRQLYLASDGGSLKRFPDSHLRRPRARSHWTDMAATAKELKETLERSDWATMKRHHEHFRSHRPSESPAQAVTSSIESCVLGSSPYRTSHSYAGDIASGSPKASTPREQSPEDMLAAHLSSRSSPRSRGTMSA